MQGVVVTRYDEEMSALRSVPAVLVLALVACSSYGASDPQANSPTDAGATTADASKDDAASGNDAAGANDANTDGGGGPFSEKCPPCDGSVDACVASGCAGASANSACDRPYDVTSKVTIVVFACPEGITTPLPAEAACGGGGPKHGALFRLGSAPTTWKVTASGMNPFVVFGDCTGNTGGGCSSSLVSKDVQPFLNVFVGTSSAITSCVQIQATFDPQ